MSGIEPQESLPGSESAGPISAYRKLDTARRRHAAAVYGVAAAAAALLAVITGVTLMWATAAGMLAVIAGYHVLTAWHIEVSDMDAIGIASETVTFEFGHGSTTLGYRGFLAKPVWEVLLFAAGPAPDHQALVTVDALDGSVTGCFEEPVPIP